MSQNNSNANSNANISGPAAKKLFEELKKIKKSDSAPSIDLLNKLLKTALLEKKNSPVQTKKIQHIPEVIPIPKVIPTKTPVHTPVENILMIDNVLEFLYKNESKNIDIIKDLEYKKEKIQFSIDFPDKTFLRQKPVYHRKVEEISRFTFMELPPPAIKGVLCPRSILKCSDSEDSYSEGSIFGRQQISVYPIPAERVIPEMKLIDMSVFAASS